MSHARHLLESYFGFGFIGIGVLFAVFNWIFLWMDWKAGSSRHVSMVYGLGFLLPIGCLIIPDLRPHALWVWLLDPASAFLVFWPIIKLASKKEKNEPKK